MKKLTKIIWIVSALLLVGCGGGSSDTSNTVSSSGLSNEYNGVEEKAILSEDNSLKFIQAVNYLENFDFSDLPTLTSKRVTVDNHIDKNTGLGYFIVSYDNYLYKAEQTINGQVRTDILDIKESTNSYMMELEVNYDITISTNDNNITYKLIEHGILDVSEDSTEIISLVVKKLHIYDQKQDETIEFLPNSDQRGKLYLSNEGYVDLTNIDKSYTLTGNSGTSLKLLFKDEEPIYETRYLDPADPINGEPEPYQEKVYTPKKGQGVIERTLNGKKENDLYFVNLQVSTFEPPKFYEINTEPALLEYAFFSWHTHYKLLNQDLNSTEVSIEWFVNGIKVDTPIMYELPSDSFMEGDTVKVVVTATHEDISVTVEQLLEGYDTNYNVASGAYEYPENIYDIEYRTNTLEFDFDVLAHEYFESIDLNRSQFSWYINRGLDDYRIINNTEYNTIPVLLADNYGSLYEPLYLRIYEGHEFKVVRFNITLLRGSTGIGGNVSDDIIDSIDEVNLTNNTEFFDVNKVEHIDIDQNGLDDIIYMSQTANGGFLNISYQNEKRVFETEKIKSEGGLFLGDFDGDTKQEAFLFSDENKSKIVSLEKNNMQIVKELNLSNYYNILDVKSVADMNNDGKDDLIVANNQKRKLYIYENLNDLNQTRLVGASECRSIQAINDINNDGLNDIICTPQDKNEYNMTTDEVSSDLEIKYFIQNDDQSFELRTRSYRLRNTLGINVFGATMLDESHIAVSVHDTNGYALYTCDLNSDSTEPYAIAGSNTSGIDAFFPPTDINADGLPDLISFEQYGNGGRLHIFPQIGDFHFDSDYSVEIDSYNQLIESRFLRNSFLDDIDKDASLEIVTVNGENQFSYINLK